MGYASIIHLGVYCRNEHDTNTGQGRRTILRQNFTSKQIKCIRSHILRSLLLRTELEINRSVIWDQSVGCRWISVADPGF